MAMIPLTQGKFAQFSDADAATILQHKWWAVFLGAGWYAATKIQGRRVLMHRLLMGLQVGDKTIVDHINGDGLDNRKENIRLANHTLNMRNRKRNSNNTTGKSGIHFRASHGPSGAWVAVAMRDGKFVTKSFGCHRRGADEARRLAEEWRNAHEAEYGITVREGEIA